PGNQPAVIHQAQAGLSLKRNHPEPKAFAAEVIGCQPDWQVSDRRPFRPQPNCASRAIRQPLDIDQTLDPQPGCAMTNRILLQETLLSCQEFTPAGRVDNPAGVDGDSIVVDGKSDSVPRIGGKHHAKIADGGLEGEVRMLEV